ncbi:hypothetical protein HRR83_002262 [Exophiala dermatitidis]|uniref:Uncharacterized protein n=1 Tax=Exophiala dermatitidis TaxID=5970 RepID=A0AAN6EZB7_EXODE|nr:hypothetical protein HRR74_002339 [Exophiala dermatitidis]KAJ4525586.1 hypothetical protein HRR73_002316 [Exophiala dermatitidis]KAJ4536904.1 hypothetical protein HRR76_004929 [Exophiala dermatitidis]KAJ4568801.1 hypothetical protein HRR81_006458 [Exophiala dermatitidis]KAJ4572189.1 hypothetical protein HRR79_003394 [Exophiala dermatitidis]
MIDHCDASSTPFLIQFPWPKCPVVCRVYIHLPPQLQPQASLVYVASVDHSRYLTSSLFVDSHRTLLYFALLAILILLYLSSYLAGSSTDFRLSIDNHPTISFDDIFHYILKLTGALLAGEGKVSPAAFRSRCQRYNLCWAERLQRLTAHLTLDRETWLPRLKVQLKDIWPGVAPGCT